MSNLKPLPPPAIDVRQIAQAFGNIIRSYVNVVVHHWSEDPTKPIGTAVRIRAGNHLFAVTAAHCVHEDMTLYIPNGSKCGRIIKTMIKEPFDVAILELENSSKVTACDLRQVSAELPAIQSENEEPRILWMAGFPAKYAKLENDHLSVSQIVVGTNRVASPNDELRLYYHEEAFGIDQKDLTIRTKQMPHPGGFSGAGVWGFLKPRGGQQFEARIHVRLYGIEYEWLDRSRFLKCVPAKVVLDILFENYPHLREKIERRETP